MKLEYSKRFMKAYERLADQQQRDVDQAVMAYIENRAAANLKDHALKGRMKGLRAFSAGWDLRIIYEEKGGFISILLIDVGTHNQVY